MPVLYFQNPRNEFERYGTGLWTKLAPDNELKADLLNFACITPRKSIYWHPHNHAGYELIVPAANHIYKCLVNNTEITVSPGEALLLNPDDLHIDILEPKQMFYAFNFSLNMLKGPLKPPRIFVNGLPPAERIFTINSPRLYRQIKELEGTLKRQDDTVYYIVNSLFGVIFWELIASIQQHRLSPALLRKCQDDKLLGTLQRIFDDNLSSNLTNRDIATALNISLSQVTHRLPALLGESPARAFLRYRIKYAEKLLLLSPGISVKEVANRLGFTNEFHFSRAFKRLTGKVPSSIA